MSTDRATEDGPSEPIGGERTAFVTCVLCEASCGLEVRLRDERITSIRGHADDPLSRGHICPKGVALQDLHEDPDRLRTPLRKVDGQWQEVSWDEAIEHVVQRLSDIRREYGNDAVAVYLGNPNVHSLGALTHGVQFVRTLRSRNTYSATSLDQLPHQLIALLLYGHQFLLPIPDIDRTALFVLFGGNPMASNGSMMTVPDFPGRLRELRARGGRFVVVDPRRTESAQVADEHHFVRPGTDAAVLLAILGVLFAEDLTRPAAYVDGVAELRDAVAAFTPEAAASVSGMSADAIRDLARAIANAPSAAVHGRLGVSTQAFGSLCQWAIHCINALTGNLDREGGTLLTSPAIDAVGMGLLGKGHLGRWHSRIRGLPEFGSELPVAALAEEIDTPGADQVRALVTMAGNPVSSAPGGGGRLDRALDGLEFMVAIDFYVNETTRHADVILPPTGPLERDHYDLIFHTFAVRDTARWSDALFPKPAGARHDWEIYRDLALGLQARASADASVADVGQGGAPQRVVDEARLRMSPAKQLDALLRLSGHSVEELRATPGGADLGPLRAGQLPERLKTAGRRIELAQPLMLTELARAADVLLAGPPEIVAGRDLLLIGRRHQRDNNSWLHNQARLTKGRPRHHLLAHPDDLAARGIASGGRVRVTSASGSVEVECLASGDLMPGVVSLPHGYGHARPGVRMTQAVTVTGVSANDLTDPSIVEGVAANAVVNGVPVRVDPIP